MARRFVRSVAVVGTIGLSSLGAGPAAAALTAPVVQTVQVSDLAGDVAHDDAREDETSLVDLSTAAAAIGVGLPALRTELHAPGATLASVSADHGVPTARLEAALVAEAARRLDAAALAGRLSTWELQERRAVLGDVVAASVQADRSIGAV